MTMNVQLAALRPLSARLPAALSNANRSWDERAGLLLELSDERGTVGRGEASPLPGYSPDELEACRAALAALPSLSVDLAAPLVPQLAAASALISAELPAARFAVESALLDLAGRRLGAPAHALLGAARPAPVALSAAADGEDPIATARAAWARGIRVVKRKIGPHDDGVFARLRSALPELGVRLDANRSLPEELAAARLRALAPLGPELVEEPCRDLASLGVAPVPIAADESLREGWPTAIVSAIVLKPALLGGIARCLELAQRARAQGIHVIVTHMWDGPLALAAAAALALALAPERACGLDRHSGLALGPEARLPFLSEAQIIAGEWAGLGVEP
jgi:o-succinylbenzoate synthase